MRSLSTSSAPFARIRAISTTAAANRRSFTPARAYGIGTGLRYLSPVGPIRFDVGYKLSRRITGFDSDGKAIFEKPFAYFITLGYAF